MKAKETLSINFNKENPITITSDKGFKNGPKETFDAFGNVIINQGIEVIYGEAAHYDLKKSYIDVKGNARLVAPEMTLYGSSLHFDIKQGVFSVQNARIHSSNYVILGEKIKRVSAELILAENAEYTTCKDCPESWSIFGTHVKIHTDNYIYITSAIIKINSIPVLYLPYVVLPIKKTRQTGFLMPKFKIDFREGPKYRQSFFWAIDENMDATITPYSKAKRGGGVSHELNYILGDRKEFSLYGAHVWDPLYDPKNPGDYQKKNFSTYRHLWEYEHHFQLGNRLNHHFIYQKAGDFDFFQNFPDETHGRLLGPDLKIGGHIDFYDVYFNLGIESYQYDSMLVDPLKNKIEKAVTVSPKINFSTPPVSVFTSEIPFAHNISIGQLSHFDRFRQNKKHEKIFYRNVDRLMFIPYANWYFGEYGPFHFESRYTFQYNHYHLVNENPGNNYFYKRHSVITSKISFELEKIFGVASFEKINNKYLTKKQNEKEKEYFEQKKINKSLIGSLPPYKGEMTNDLKEIEKKSYRHSLGVDILHHYLTDEDWKGNHKFKDQIFYNGVGQFDINDSFIERIHSSTNLAMETNIPINNTIELNITNLLIEKSVAYKQPIYNNIYQNNSYNYKEIGHFNISQGFVLSDIKDHSYFSNSRKNNNFTDRLTRLGMNTGLTLGHWALNISDFYFWQTNKNKLDFEITHSLKRVTSKVIFHLDELRSPDTKDISLSLDLYPIDLFQWYIQYDYNLQNRQKTKIIHQFIFSPENNCWKFMLGYRKDTTGSYFTLDFLLNFGEGIFNPILSPGHRYMGQKRP